MATRPSRCTATASLTAAATSRSTGSGADGARLGKPIDLGNCSLKTIYSISTERIILADVEARMGTVTVASGDLTLNDPFKDNAALLAHLSAVQIDLAALKARLEMARSLNKPLAWLAAALVSGRVTVEGATYQGELRNLGWSATALSHALQLSVRLEAVSLKLPNLAALPALSQANAAAGPTPRAARRLRKDRRCLAVHRSRS